MTRARSFRVDCSYRGSERVVIASNTEVMDCGRKIDRLTINVIVLRGAIRQGGIVARYIYSDAMRRAAHRFGPSACQNEVSDSFLCNLANLSPAPKFCLGLVDCKLRLRNAPLLVHQRRVVQMTRRLMTRFSCIGENQSNAKTYIFNIFP